MITKEYTDSLYAELQRHTPLVAEEPEGSPIIAALWQQITKYDDLTGQNAPVHVVLNLARQFESTLQTKAAEKAQTDAAEAARQARINRDMKQPSSVDRAEVIEELKARQHKPERQAFVPAREYTEKEIEDMHSDVYARLILGGKPSNLNLSSGPPIEAKKPQTIKRQAYDSRRAHEEADRATRQKNIAFDQQQKAQMRADVKAALKGAR